MMETNTGKGKTCSMKNEVEKHVSKLSATCCLTAAAAALGTSLVLRCLHKKHAALFVGEWVAPFLILGLYGKLMRGGDKEHFCHSDEKHV